MLTKELQALKTTLLEAIESWAEDQAETEGWGQVGYVGELHAELMTEAAFNILLTIKDTNEYFEINQLIV